MSTDKQVRFSEVTIHEHAYELGDNPQCSSGAPLTIGWKAQKTHTRNIEMYEYTRSENRRSRKQLMLPTHERGQLLLRAGYTLDQIGAAAMQVQEIKKMRADSLKKQGFDNLNVFLESTAKLPKGLFQRITKPVRKTVQARSA